MEHDIEKHKCDTHEGGELVKELPYPHPPGSILVQHGVDNLTQVKCYSAGNTGGCVPFINFSRFDVCDCDNVNGAAC